MGAQGKSTYEPGRDCILCPRLAEFRHKHRALSPDWHNAPVPTWYPDNNAISGAEKVKLLVVGLAPGLRGANRTGRPFTGDHAGDLLYATMTKFGFAGGEYGANPDDNLSLIDAAITNSVRCVPPQNKPVGAEINACRPFLLETIARLPNLKTILTLGKIAHDSTARTLGTRVASVKFGHNLKHEMNGHAVFSSYHCSRYNTNTGVLTEEMFDDVFRSIREFINSDP